MKTFSINISGSGTKNQIEISLITIVRELQSMEDNDIENFSSVAPFFEDPILCAEIEAE